MTTAERLVALMDHLGLGRAHLATQMPGDVVELAQSAGARVAGLVLLVPTRLDPVPFSAVEDRLLLISGDSGITDETTGRAAQRLGRAQRHVLATYAAAGWSDVMAERGAEVSDAMVRFLGGVDRHGAGAAAVTVSGEGECAGLHWQARGRGPALLLLPFFLAPSQWEPAIAALAEHFTVIRVSGPHIGGVAALEDRARAPTYRAMFRTLIDLMAPEPGDRILDVGCGSGALDRLLADRLGASARIVAADLNAFFLGEARGLAARAGLAERITFVEGSATALPFEDDAFEHAFSITVLEECDADRAIAELVRVVKPGGRIGLVVRAIDVPQWWNLELPASISAKASVPPQSVGPGGVADRSLYLRMRKAGLEAITAFPSLITLDRPEGPIWRYREDAVLPQLTSEEARAWHAATSAARAEGLLMQAHVMHAAVARKP